MTKCGHTKRVITLTRDNEDMVAEVERLRRALRNIHRMPDGVTDGQTYDVVQALVEIQHRIKAILAGEPMPEDWV